MTKLITAFQRMTLDDSVDSDHHHAEAILRGNQKITSYHAGADCESFLKLMETTGADEFRVYKHSFFCTADASKLNWKYEGPVINFMCDIKKYFDKSGADEVYIQFR